jgi:hypothetical protein
LDTFHYYYKDDDEKVIDAAAVVVESYDHFDYNPSSAEDSVDTVAVEIEQLDYFLLYLINHVIQYHHHLFHLHLQTIIINYIRVFVVIQVINELTSSLFLLS